MYHVYNFSQGYFSHKTIMSLPPLTPMGCAVGTVLTIGWECGINSMFFFFTDLRDYWMMGSCFRPYTCTIFLLVIVFKFYILIWHLIAALNCVGTSSMGTKTTYFVGTSSWTKTKTTYRHKHQHYSIPDAKFSRLFGHCWKVKHIYCLQNLIKKFTSFIADRHRPINNA